MLQCAEAWGGLDTDVRTLFSRPEGGTVQATAGVAWEWLAGPMTVSKSSLSVLMIMVLYLSRKKAKALTAVNGYLFAFDHAAGPSPTVP